MSVRNFVYSLLLLFLLSTGCATFTRARRQEERRETARTYLIIPVRDSENPDIIYWYITLEDESYFDILNKQSRERIQETQFYNKWSQIRHIGFFGRLTEYEKEFGAKLVFPW